MNLSDFKELTIGVVKLKELLINGIQVWKAISYTNQIPISTDANGNIYNGKGWKENTFINAGNESAASGRMATGYIPCKVGDVIRFKNMAFTPTNYSRLSIFDANKSYIYQINGSSSYHMVTEFEGVTDDSGNYIQLTIKEIANQTKGMAYFRIHCPTITQESIITINQEIT